MALDYGLKGSIDIADSRTRALTLRADGEPVFNPAANRWASELQASDGAWRFLRGGSAAGRGVGNSFDAALADNFTVLCLVRGRKPNWSTAVGKLSNGVTTGWVIQQGPQNHTHGLFVRVDSVLSGNHGIVTQRNAKDLAWHWFAATFSGLNVSSWLDSGVKSSSTRPVGDLTNTQNFNAGTANGQINIAATLIYSRVLTDAEVSNIMSGRTMPREVSGLIGYYKFNEGTGTTCTDHSGQGNHLTYTSPVWETYKQNLVTNGTFDTDTGWTKGAGVTISDGKANFATSGTVANALYQSCVRAGGGSYLFEADVTVTSGTYEVHIGGMPASPVSTLSGRVSIPISCNSSGNGNVIIGTASSFTGTFDNIIVTPLSGESGQPYTPAVLKTQSWWDRLPPAIADPEMMGCSWGAVASIAYQPVMNLTGDLTAAAWRKPLKSRSGGELNPLSTSFVTVRGPVGIAVNGTVATVDIGDTATKTSSSFNLTKPVPLGKWTHWAVTLQGTALSLYLNGVLIGTQTNAAAHGSTSAYSLIDAALNARNAARSIRLFSRALSASEVNELFLTDRIGNRTRAEVTYGPELVTNGGFDSAAGWTLTQPTSGVSSITSGLLTLQTLDGSYTAAAQSLTTVIGKTYLVTVTCLSATGALATFSLGAGGGTGTGSASVVAAGSYSAYVVASSTGMVVEIKRAGGSTNGTATFDNISVKEITGITPGLVGEWLCNTPHSTTITDTSGNGLHTTTSNPRLLDSPYQVARRKRFGKQLRTSNLGEAKTGTVQALNGATRITISAWMKNPTRKPSGAFFGLQTTSGTSLLSMVATTQNRWAGLVRSKTSDSSTSIPCNLSFSDMQPVLFALEYDYTTQVAKAYQNGVLVYQATVAITGNSGFMADNGCLILAASAASWIDSARIYNRSLSATEHYQLFLDQAPRDGLVAEYLFENDVSNCQDTSGNGFHATWSGISAANYVREI